MLRELIGFLPWILFGYLSSESYTLGAEVALLTSSLIALPEIFKKKVKVFTLGTLIFFIALIIISMRPDLVKLEHWTSPASYGMLFLISLVSILIKTPFTIQYAKEEVPEEYWESDLFIQINYHLTYAWTLGFFLDTLCSFIALEYPDIHHLAFRWIPTGILVFLIWYNGWYPEYAKKNAVVPTEFNIDD
jgi:hypothetical protein